MQDTRAVYARFRRESVAITGMCLIGGTVLCVLFWCMLRHLERSLTAKHLALMVEVEHRRLAEIKANDRFPNEDPNPVLRISAEGKVLYGNSASKLLLSAWSSHILGPLPAQWQDVVRQTIASRRNQGRETVCAERVFFLMFTPNHQSGDVNIYGHDITLLKDAEQKLQQSNRQLKQLAATDPLTGLPNRRYLLDTIKRELAMIKRHGGSCVVAMVDVDQLKVINDIYGHSVGDEALRSVAQTSRDTLRSSDFLSRWGGDEFLFLLRQTTLEEAVAIMDRLREEIAARSIRRERRAIGINLSIGLADLTSGIHLEPGELLAQADQALYAAKHEGGNCTRTKLDVSEAHAAEPSPTRTKQMQQQIVKLARRVKDISAQGIWSLIQALEARDLYTRGHAENVTRYAVGIAQTIGLSDADVEIVRRASIVHDIGKIGVPDHILLKPGKLADDERMQMQSHVMISVRILQEMQLLEREIPIVRNHHERWDGKGYPEGLADNAIPFGARILAVADAFDAITSDRVYRRARSLEDAMSIIGSEAGKQFDPAVVNAFAQWLGNAQATVSSRALTTQDLLMIHADDTILGLTA